MDEKDKQLAFVVNLLHKVITNNHITSEEIQALENIANELPDVDETDFRW